MAANLHIHAFEGITEQDLADFFINNIGSKYFNLLARSGDKWDAAYRKISETPNIWIGEVSWLKAAVFEDSDSFVPGNVASVSELIGEDLPTLDDELEGKILKAVGVENKTSYSTAEQESVAKFLSEHKGKKLFTVSW